MKKHITRSPRHIAGGGGSILFLLAMVICSMLFPGCTGSDGADTLELLSTVPADAEAVGVLQVNTLVTQTGGKVKDGRIEDAKALKEACVQLYTTLGSKDVRYHELFFSPDSGLEPTSMVMFSYKGSGFLSALVADEAKLKESVSRIAPGEWETVGKSQVNGEFVIREGRFWTMPNGMVESVERFANLSEVESFRSNAYAETLSKSTDALSVWASVEGLMKVSGLSFAQQTTTRMALGMFFNSPNCITMSANVDKDILKAQMRILDSDLKPAKCELAVSKIDTKLVESLGGNANFVFSASVSQKLVKQLLNLASSFGGNLPEPYASALDPIDGTIVFAASMTPKEGFSGLGFKGAVQTSGKNNARLLQVLEPFVGKVQIDGDTFRFGNEGYGSGVAQLTDVAKDFSGGWLGLAGAMNFQDRPPYYFFSAVLVPSDGSLRLDFKLNLK